MSPFELSQLNGVTARPMNEFHKFRNPSNKRRRSIFYLLRVMFVTMRWASYSMMRSALRRPPGVRQKSQYRNHLQDQHQQEQLYQQSASSQRGSSNSIPWLSIVASIPLLMCFRDYTFSLVRVKGSSMEPTLREGDIILVRRADFPGIRRVTDAQLPPSMRASWRQFTPGLQWQWYRQPPLPHRGKVVVFKSPDHGIPYVLYVKRVIGLEAETVRQLKRDMPPHFVKKNSIWVEGDNYKHSHDSRQHGAISRKLVVGMAEYVLWPPRRWGKIPEPQGDDSGVSRII